jgi:hypothetical protein
VRGAGRGTCRRRISLLGLTTLGLALAILLAGPAGSGGSASAQGCITRLPVTVTLPSGFAAAYRASIPLTVSSTTGRPITGLRAALYTFAGDQIAASRRPVTLRSSGTLSLRLAFAPLQEGSYTLVLTGAPNTDPSCGPKKFVEVVRFRGCVTALPLKFVNPPGGTASDYANYLSVTLASTGSLIRSLEGTVYASDGTRFGDGTLSALYGQTTLNLRLNRPLVAGGYTVVVAGLVEQPSSCGPKTAQVDLEFK